MTAPHFDPLQEQRILFRAITALGYAWGRSGMAIVKHRLARGLPEARIFPEVVSQRLDKLLPGTLREKLGWECHVTTAAFLLDRRVRDGCVQVRQETSRAGHGAPSDRTRGYPHP